jgi:hypothetical protein
MHDDIKRQLAQLFPETAERWGRCGKKVGYPNAAAACAVKQRRERQVPGLTLTVYPCEDREHWHLSSMAPSPAHMARIQASGTEWLQGMRAEIERYPTRRATLERQFGAMMCEINQGYKRRARVPFSHRVIQELTTVYEAQKDVFVRLEDVYEELWYLDLRYAQVRAFAEVLDASTKDLSEAEIEARRGVLTATMTDAFIARISALVETAELDREAIISGMHRALAQLEADRARDVAQAKASLTEWYLHPIR